MNKIAVDGDTVSQEDAHCPGCAGAGTYPINPVTLQDFVFIAGKLIIPNNQTYSAHGSATVNASSTLLFVNGAAVARDKDPVSHHHSNNGVTSIGQDFVFE